MITKNEIREWLGDGEWIKASHMMIILDNFSNESYPVYIMLHEDVREMFRQYNHKNMQEVHEIYSFSYNLEKQLTERRAFYLD